MDVRPAALPEIEADSSWKLPIRRIGSPHGHALSARGRRAGYQADQVCDGQQAVDKIRENDISAIIPDLMMPRERLRWTRESQSRSQVRDRSFRGAAGSDRRSRTCLCALSKPFDLEALIDAVDRCVAA